MMGRHIETKTNRTLHGSDLKINCGNNKMLESDWFLTALIYCLIWLVQHQTVRLLAACNRTGQIGQLNSQ